MQNKMGMLVSVNSITNINPDLNTVDCTVKRFGCQCPLCAMVTFLKTKRKCPNEMTALVHFRHGSTPSPLSPTPSPAGSVGSIGSNGSNSSGEGNHSQNGRHSASVTSPVSVSIPQRIHSVMAQHVSCTSKLVNSIDMWDKADALSSDYRGKIRRRNQYYHFCQDR